MIIYIYSKCSTCQDALKYLEAKKISFIAKEIVQTPPSVQELQKMLELQQGNIKKLLNTSGILYREMQLAEKLPPMPLNDIFELLSTHGMLVKRPFLLDSTFGLLGFKKPEWDAKF